MGQGGSQVLNQMLRGIQGYLQPDEDDLRELTDSALGKLRRMTDADFEAVDLYPDFDPFSFSPVSDTSKT